MQTKFAKHYLLRRLVMAQTCNGLCERLKSPSVKNKLRYKSGQKRCSLCAEYFLTDAPRCPCCTTRLRTGPRTKRRSRIQA